MKNKFIKIEDEKAYLIDNHAFQGFEIKAAMEHWEELRFQELLDFVKEGLKWKI